MKVISLNTWGARAGIENLLAFFKKRADVDIFCLQEMWNGGENMIGKVIDGVDCTRIEPQLLKKVAAILENHNYYFRPIYRDHYGMGIFIKKEIPVLEEGEAFVYKERGWRHPTELANHARNVHYIKCSTPGGERTIAHVHALWNGEGKGDSSDRLEQSKKILAALPHLPETILCGDFNLLPQTESIRILERAGLRNLILDYKIKSTRTSYYKKDVPFADYMFVGNKIKVSDFTVLPDEVSDHKALCLEFE